MEQHEQWLFCVDITSRVESSIFVFPTILDYTLFLLAMVLCRGTFAQFTY